MKLDASASEFTAVTHQSSSYRENVDSKLAASNFKGIWAPCVTPLNDKLEINHQRLIEHVNWLLNSGCHGIVLFGTTGEAPSFSVSERTTALVKLLESGIDPTRLIVGNGFAAFTDTINVTNHALELGCSQFLMIPPFYFKELSVKGVVASYRRVFDRLISKNFRIVLYHFPRLSGVQISCELIDKLLHSHGDHIAGVKDSSGDWKSVERFINCYPQLSIFPGSDMLLLDALKIGGVGTITATANINPGEIRNVYDLWKMGGCAELAQVQAEKVRTIVFQYPLAAALKCVIGTHHADSDWLRVRPPLTELSKSDQKGLLDSLDSIGFRLRE